MLKNTHYDQNAALATQFHCETAQRGFFKVPSSASLLITDLNQKQVNQRQTTMLAKAMYALKLWRIEKKWVCRKSWHWGNKHWYKSITAAKGGPNRTVISIYLCRHKSLVELSTDGVL